MPNEERRIEFHVTNDHVVLLKRLCMRTSVCVNDPDDQAYWGLFTCRPDIGKKRPFGNSGDPAVSALEEIGVHPDEETGEYAPGWYGYGRMVLIELPLAYEAVMQHGIIEPCTERISPLSAWFEYKSRRAIEYWRDALTEIAALPGMDERRLVEFAMNARNDTPVRWAKDFSDMAESAGPDSWIAKASGVINRRLAAKWLAKPDCPKPAMSDSDVLLGLMMGRLTLEWPGQAVRPENHDPGGDADAAV